MTQIKHPLPKLHLRRSWRRGALPPSTPLHRCLTMIWTCGPLLWLVEMTGAPHHVFLHDLYLVQMAPACSMWQACEISE